MRDSSVSIAKGIAIILMVLAHSRFSEYGNYWINMFHMPLFFFLSGYCFKEKYLDTPKDYIIKKVKGIYWPFVKWSLVFLLLHNIFFSLNIYNDLYGFRGAVSHLYALKGYGVHTFHIITRMSDNEQLLGGFWFLKTLFVTSIFGYAAIRLFRKYMLMGGVILLGSTMALSLVHRDIPYFGVGARELFATMFFISGYGYKQLNIDQSKYNWIIIIVALVMVTIGVQYWQATLLNFTWWKVIPYYITAILGTIAVFQISKQISNHKLKTLTYIGDNTLTILTWHMLSFKIVSLAIIGIYQLPIERLAEFPTIEEYSQMGWFIPYTIVGVAIPMLFSKIKILR